MTNFQGVTLEETHLTNPFALEPHQITRAKALSQTPLDDSVLQAIKGSFSHLLNKPKGPKR